MTERARPTDKALVILMRRVRNTMLDMAAAAAEERWSSAMERRMQRDVRALTATSNALALASHPSPDPPDAL